MWGAGVEDGDDKMEEIYMRGRGERDQSKVNEDCEAGEAVERIMIIGG